MRGWLLRGRRGESSAARPSPVAGTRTSLDGRAGPGLHTSVGTAGSWDGPPRCSCDGIPDGNRPPRRTPSCSTASSASRAPRRSKFACHTTVEARSSGVETPPRWPRGIRPTPGGAVRGPCGSGRESSRTRAKQSTTVIRGNNVWNALRGRPAVGVDRLGGVLGFDVPRFGRNTP